MSSIREATPDVVEVVTKAQHKPERSRGIKRQRLDWKETWKETRIWRLEKALMEKDCIINGLKNFIEEQYRIIDAQNQTIRDFESVIEKQKRTIDSLKELLDA
ncbi:hypothetical protein AAVH_20798 [Aphelenchoides avenae]|nr:hypothetical protein AAVH_20798 [Aphelenchus avenae]